MRIAGTLAGNGMMPIDVLNFPALEVGTVAIGKIDALSPKTISFPSLVNASGYGTCAYGAAFCVESAGPNYVGISLPSLQHLRGARISKTQGIASISMPSLLTLPGYELYVSSNSAIGNCEVDPGFDFGVPGAPSPCT